MKKGSKILASVALAYICINLSTSHIPFLHNRAIKNQINYISKQLDKKEDTNLQKKYPEGLLFANCLFALTLIEMSNYPHSYPSRHLESVESCLQKIISPKGSASFNRQLNLPHGAFYNGWTSYTLKKYLSSRLSEYSKNRKILQNKYDSLTSEIKKVQLDSLHIIESYSNSIWPADNLACIASLPDHDQELKVNWLNLLQQNTSNSFGLINHDNYDKTIARGSSQALILYFLKEINEPLAHQLNEIFYHNFIKKYMGIHFVKEYYDDGEVDIDSGPIILGFGSVGTIMNIKTQSALDNKLKFTWNFLNMLGIPVNVLGNKHYLFKQELMFDIFMLWAAISLKQ